jgi:hypothetical protein
MNENDIRITLTESQHELLNEVLNHAIEAINLASPYGDGMWDLPLDNPIVQRYTMLENMKEMFFELWRDRFADTQP